mmetsp:Transcript_21123/g.37905  ORF Transcript_21123/g.37905 Transcript_21123/m.37905 type:complete len:517 (+) Transcript_21123:86-1636(+)
MASSLVPEDLPKVLEAAELTDMELQVLDAVLGEEMCAENTGVVLGSGAKMLRKLNILVQSNALQRVCEDAIMLHIELPPLYPFSLPSMQVDAHGYLKQVQADQLYTDALNLAATQLGQPMILQIVDMARKFILTAIEQNAQVMAQSNALFISQRGKQILDLLHKELPDDTIHNDIIYVPDSEGFKLESMPANADFDVYHAGTISTQLIEEANLPLVSDFISIHDLFRRLPSYIAIMKIECIMRLDIAAKFDKYRNELVSRYDPTKGKKAEMAEPEVMFHGTATSAASSIVRTGLIPPGKRGVKIRNGAAYGHGIYLGKHPETSISYCRADSYDGEFLGNRLFVCAVLKGLKSNELVYDAADFCVVGNDFQVLPLYVIHFHSYDSDMSKDMVYSNGISYLTMSDGGMLLAVQNHPSHRNHETLHDTALKAARNAAIQNASFYIDTTKFKVVDVAPIDEDDDFTPYYDSSTIGTVFGDDSIGYEACGASSGFTQTTCYQYDRIVETEEDEWITFTEYV